MAAGNALTNWPLTVRPARRPAQTSAAPRQLRRGSVGCPPDPAPIKAAACIYRSTGAILCLFRDLCHGRRDRTRRFLPFHLVALIEKNGHRPLAGRSIMSELQTAQNVPSRPAVTHGAEIIERTV